jgi:CheY-like chemotaxis protein
MKKVRILLVEDDEFFASVLEHVLGQAGHKIISTRNGKEALRLYDPQVVGLVLTDLVMPEMEGMEFITRLRQLQPDVKIIAMSGGLINSAKVYLPAARLLGANCTLVKPFSNERLLTAIQEVLEAAA